MQSARSQIAHDLEIGSRVFSRLIENRTQQLSEETQILSMDFAFLKAFTTSDRGTILSALENLSNRIKASVAMLISLEYDVIADTSHPDLFNKPFEYPELIENCEEYGRISSIVPYDDNYYQMVVVPLLAPDPIAWFCIGFPVDKALVNDFQELILSHVSLLLVHSGSSIRTIITSTLPSFLHTDLFNSISDIEWEIGKSVPFNMGTSEFVTLIIPLEKNNNFIVYAVLQRSMDEVLQPYYRLRKTIFILFISGILVSVLATFFISRTVTKPVYTLVEGVREIEKGNYDHYVSVTQKDEMGHLSNAFNNMVIGLKERDFIKSTFERYVSTAVATEIIKNPDMVQLGGQKKTLTIFFTDIGDFTNLSEILSPEEVVKHLNYYFRGMCAAMLEYNGTINEFLGDAILAFWGAPIAQENHALLACRAALRCREFLGHLEKKWVAEGLPPRTYRFGINTGEVVVGNVGSPSRFKYSAVGDDVNLASRIEGVNKYYGTQILISEKTYSLTKDMFIARDIDIIRVVGNSKPIKVYELVAEKGQIDEKKSKQLEHFDAGVRAYRARQWEEAISCFMQVLNLAPEDKPTKVYVQRCQEYQQIAPAQDWDGVYNLTSK